jgi:hypothetical protein
MFPFRRRNRAKALPGRRVPGYRPTLEPLEGRYAPAGTLKPTISTTPSVTSVTLGTSPVTLKDTATVSGGSAPNAQTPTGTVTFTLYQGSTLIDTEVGTLSNGTCSTPTGFTLGTTRATQGTYQWDASYSGDTNFAVATDTNATGEQVVVGPAITTTPSTTSVTLADSTVTLTDTATLSGATNPTGTITFTLVAPDKSTTVDSESVLVSGNNSYSTPTGYTLPTTGNATGTYQWNVSYSGDANNISVSDNNASGEQVAVASAAPTLSATAGNTVVLGTGKKLTDSATLAGGYSPGGYITFTLTTPGSSTVTTDIVMVKGNGTYSTTNGYLPTAIGTYEWTAKYSGDVNNAAANSAVTEAAKAATTPTLTTKAGAAVAISSATKLTDSATLSGGSSPTGTITFYLFAPGVTPNASNSNNIYSSAFAVTGNHKYPAPPYTPSGTGTVTGAYQWVVVYSGDNKNNAVTVSATEQVNLATPMLTTKASTQVVLGTKLTASATLSVGFNPVGFLLFTLAAPGGSIVDSETVPVTGNGTYATTNGYTATAAGTYQWMISYSGDGNNKAVSTRSGAYPQKATAANTPTLTAKPGGTVTVGSGVFITDSATLSGGSSPTGTITFTLYFGNTAVHSEKVSVTAGTSMYKTPTGYLPAAGGTYEWVASYSGDANNNAVSSYSFEVAVVPVIPRWQR